MNNSLTPREKNLIKYISKGHNTKEAAKLSGYTDSSANTYVYMLLRKPKMIKALEEMGLTDRYLAKSLKTNIDTGVGVKSTAETANRAIEIASHLKGYMDKDNTNNNTYNQTNIYIQELKQLDDKTLLERIDKLNKDILSIKTAKLP